MENQFQKICSNLSLLNKLFINKVFINVCFIFFGIVLLTAFILFICSLTVNKEMIKNIIWPALGLFIADLILFYIFEFIRRRCRNELISYFNFKNLYESNLLKEKIITTAMNSINNDENILKMHLESMNHKFDNANLGKQDAIYSFYKNDCNYLFSTCYIVDYSKKTSQRNDLQIILSKTQKIKHDNYYLIYEDVNKDSVANLKFVKKHENISLYAEDNSMNFNDKLIKELADKIKQVKTIGIKLDIRISSHQIYYIFILENRLMLNLSGVKFYKDNLKKINENYLETNLYITNILKAILDH